MATEGRDSCLEGAGERNRDDHRSTDSRVRGIVFKTGVFPEGLLRGSLEPFAVFIRGHRIALQAVPGKLGVRCP
jgi:hypothetical protein